MVMKMSFGPKEILILVSLAACNLLEGCSEREPGTGYRAPSEPPSAAAIAVFPGAEGFGTRTPAGRGGRVIAVTSLADDGPGSLRAVLAEPSPRIIVFRVGGVIELRSHLFISRPFVTIAGQTAPGDGVVIKNFGIVIVTNDVLIQHVRVRPGNKGNVKPDHNDAIAILGPGSGDGAGAFNVVLDHVSASWGEDETISTWFGAHDVTISWSIISEALSRSRHAKRTHSAGLLIGDGSHRVSAHHNLLAHNDFRNPLIVSGGTHDFVNNVIYNWGATATEINQDSSETAVNLVGNTYIRGPSTQWPWEIVISPSDERPSVPKIYVEGNVGPNQLAPRESPWKHVRYHWNGEPAPERFRALEPIRTAPITTFEAEANLTRVLAGAGATAPARDGVDRRVVAEVEKRAGAIIDTPEDVGGYGRYESGTPRPDSDDDGMPDDWEKQSGLDPRDPSDGMSDLDGDGYTNVEEYLHSLLTKSQ